jgi:hypothetical protein
VARELREEWLDSQTWTVLALDATGGAHPYEPRDYSGLESLERENKVTAVEFDGNVLHGFSKMTGGPNAFWPEGVAGHVLAARIVGRPGRFLTDLLAARRRDGTQLHIIGIQESDDWKHDLRVRAIDGTVWTAWAEPGLDFNPYRAVGPVLSEDRGSWTPEQQALLLSWEREVASEVERRLGNLSSLRDRIKTVEGNIEGLQRDLDAASADR